MSRSAEHDARNTAFRGVFQSTDAARAAIPPTAETIENCAKTLNREWHVDDVPNSKGGRIHWVGNRSSKRVLLYFHGGGYGVGPSDGYVIFLTQCADWLAAAGQETVIAFLEYSIPHENNTKSHFIKLLQSKTLGLTKKVRFPTQMRQATESLRFILGKGYMPLDILVGGDSAGGNLAIAVISNILHPHPAVPPLTLNGQLAGLLLISPWVIFSTSAPSFEECEHKDIHSKAALYNWADDFASPADRNNYTEPLRADVSWWSGQCAKKILNLAGEYEMFRDDLKAFGRVLEKAKLDVKTISCPKQVHIDCILDAQSGLEPGLMSEEIWKWLDTAYQE